MAYTDAYNIFQSDGSTEEALIETYGRFIDQVQKQALSVQLKNTNLSGDPQAGSVKVRRLMSASVENYGTARTAGEGDAVNNNGVTINLDNRKEIVEEINRFDYQQFGIADLFEARRENFALSMISHLDTAFFTEAEAEGTDTTVTGDNIVEEVEDLIQELETTSNDNVDGVPREMMDLVLTPATYGELENYIDTLPNPVNGGVDAKLFHRVRVHSNTRQTQEAILMVRGAVAQPVAMESIQMGKIPLSNDEALEMYFNYGTQAVASDLILYADLTNVSA